MAIFLKSKNCEMPVSHIRHEIHFGVFLLLFPPDTFSQQTAPSPAKPEGSLWCMNMFVSRIAKGGESESAKSEEPV